MIRSLLALPGHPVAKRVTVALVAVLAIVWFYPRQRVNKFYYEEGRPWNYAQLIAPFDIPIHPDSATVEKLRDTLQARFIPIYTFNKTTVDSIISQLPASPYREMTAHVLRKSYSDGVLSPGAVEEIAAKHISRMRVLDGNILSERSTAGLITVRDLYAHLDSMAVYPGLRAYYAAAKLHSLLRPNLSYDPDENKRHYDNEYQTLTADRGVILQGQAIINKGDIITPQDFTNLQTYEQLLETRHSHDSHSDLLMLAGRLIYALLLLGGVTAYCIIFDKSIYANLRAYTFVYALIAVFFLVSVGVSSFITAGSYLVPMASVPILLLVFFNSGTAIFITLVTTLLIAPITAFPLEYIFLQFSASAMAVYSLRDLSRRSQLLRTALLVALTYEVSYLGLELFMNGALEGFSWRMPIFLGINALLTSMVYILMFAVEKMFGFVSVVTLVELADTNQPLLRKLSDVCPGTFQHSMSVSNLAADAARAMGANEQLVRAGALYHDIGKTVNPAFFTENQHGVNPHDVLPPEQSARIVIGHVTDGLKLADKAGLPREVRQFIAEHHGAGKAKYFYYAYCKAHEGETIDELPFTYPGPNPQSRETSLLMMADAVEAASRSLSEYTRESLRGLVDKIIDGQIAEGLHADSSLEFRDIKLIKEAFVKRLMTMYHTRVAYPPGVTAAK